MKSFLATFAAGISLIASPALACIETSPAARAWAQCAYAEAYKTGDHRFVVSMAKATVWNKPLKPTSQRRWEAIERRIVASCGQYSLSASRDKRASGNPKFYVPESGLHAVAATSDIDKQVKS